MDDVISPARADAFFNQDIASAVASARDQANEAGSDDESLVAALILVNFQLGTHWTEKFPDTWQAIVSGNYDEAIEDAGNSLWNQQTPQRVQDFQDALAEVGGGVCLVKSNQIVAWGNALFWARDQAASIGIKDEDVIAAIASVIAFQGRDWQYNTPELREAWRDMANQDFSAAKRAIARSSWAEQRPEKAGDFQHALDNLERDQIKAYHTALDIKNSLRAADRSWNGAGFDRAISTRRYSDAAKELDGYPPPKIPANTLQSYQQTLRDLSAAR